MEYYVLTNRSSKVSCLLMSKICSFLKMHTFFSFVVVSLKKNALNALEHMTMEVDSRHVRSSTSSLSSSPYKRMFRSISNSNYRNYKNIQFFGSTSLLDQQPNKRSNYPEASNSNKEVNIKQANSNVNSDHDNLISYEHLSETSSWIELVLPFTIFAITIIAVIFIAFILFVWIRKTFREENYHRVVKKTKTLQQDNDNDEDKVKIFEERLKCSSSKKCEKNKNYSKSQNKMNSRKWLRDKAKQIVDNAVRVRDDEEQKLETIEFKSTPPTSPNSQKDVKGQEEDEDEEKVEIEEEALKDDDDCLQPNSEQQEVVHHQLNPFAASFVCPVALSDISVASIVQPQSSSAW